MAYYIGSNDKDIQTKNCKLIHMLQTSIKFHNKSDIGRGRRVVAKQRIHAKIPHYGES